MKPSSIVNGKMSPGKSRLTDIAVMKVATSSKMSVTGQEAMSTFQ